eukprot:1581075-Pyramimonas_sp.AAC.1
MGGRTTSLPGVKQGNGVRKGRLCRRSTCAAPNPPCVPSDPLACLPQSALSLLSPLDSPLAVQS